MTKVFYAGSWWTPAELKDAGTIKAMGKDGNPIIVQDGKISKKCTEKNPCDDCNCIWGAV